MPVPLSLADAKRVRDWLVKADEHTKAADEGTSSFKVDHLTKAVGCLQSAVYDLLTTLCR